MNKKVILRATKVLKECKKRGHFLYFKYSKDPIFFCSIWNRGGDLASISANSAVLEPAIYAPKWSDYIRKWAKMEGFSEEKIETENLSQEVSLEQVIDFFSYGN
ncbi:MAG: hypothetical protein EBY39_08575 [Flavobacteriia bacterium]|nr:hypothetical protein [Flavobacteriia bacterium]